MQGKGLNGSLNMNETENCKTHGITHPGYPYRLARNNTSAGRVADVTIVTVVVMWQ